MKPTRRPRERDGECLTVHVLDKSSEGACAITPQLSSFIAPMTPQQFYEQHYETRRAFAVKVHPSKRDERLSVVKRLLCDFNPRLMLERSMSAQDGISVWMRHAQSGEMLSFKAAPENALLAYQAGNALYFRGTEDIEAAFVPTLVQQFIGGGDTTELTNFGALYRDGARRGECEVFAAHAGHRTAWHNDFQCDNFTIQLRGRKKWYLRKADVEFPHRACATHFTDDASKAVLRTQHAFAHLDDATQNFNQGAIAGGTAVRMVPANIDAECETVTLEPGDVLYHPAGVWHSVETPAGGENALSINFSLFPMTWAELMTETLQTLLLRSSHWRRPVSVGPGGRGGVAAVRAKALAMLNQLRADIDLLAVDHVLPPATLVGAAQVTEVVFSAEQRLRRALPPQVRVRDLVSHAVGPDSMLTRNPLAALLELPEELDLSDAGEQSSSDDDDDDEDGDDEDEDEGASDGDSGSGGGGSDGTSKSGDSSSDADEDGAGGGGDDMTAMACFDLHSNFAADESHFGSPALRIKIRVPARLRPLMQRVCAVPAGKPIRASSLFPTIDGNLLAFLCHVNAIRHRGLSTYQRGDCQSGTASSPCVFTRNRAPSRP